MPHIEVPLPCGRWKQYAYQEWDGRERNTLIGRFGALSFCADTALLKLP
jgi:hypothetical protein